MASATAFGGFNQDGTRFTAHLNHFQTVPAVRTTRAQMYRDPAYQRYDAMKQQAAVLITALVNQSGGSVFPAKTPLTVRLTVGKAKGGRGGGRFGVWNCDIDNLAKSILDAMNGIVYVDDRYIDTLAVRKVPVENDEAEYAIITVELSGGTHEEGR